MKKEMISLCVIFADIIGSFAAVFAYNGHVSNYQEATRAYVYGAYKNGAITERECAYLLQQASSFHAYPEVRKERAEQVRKLVDRAYENQKNN